VNALRFRAPAHPVPLLGLLARALPGVGAERLASWAARGGVRVGRDAATSARTPAPPGALVVAREVPWASRAFDAVEPPGGAAGEGAWLALVPEPPWRRGILDAKGKAGQGAPLRFEVGETREGVANVRLRSEGTGALALARRLADAGFPLLGDPLHGGVLVAGGLRLRAVAAAGEAFERDGDGWWPEEPVFLPTWEPGQPAASLRVSGGTLRALSRGHPWVLPDRETGDTGRFRPGSLVRLEAREAPRAAGARRVRRERPGRDDGPIVCVEGGHVAARRWSAGDGARGAPSVETRVARALALRRELVAATPSATGTNAFRLIHGEADGLPALAVDRLGPLLRVVVSGRASDGFRERAVEALVRSLARELGAEPPVVEVLHLRDRPEGELEGVRLARGRRADLRLEADGRLVVRERGLSFLVDPGLGAPSHPTPAIGLFLDQRENRARLAARARRGGRWLNLFAHTGAFSVALLAAGAGEVVSVDLSKTYLRWLDENLERNGLAGRAHRAICGDGRRALEKWPASERFDGIVIDPPTAAASGGRTGRRFWSVRRDLPPLVEQALRRLAPGGSLLVCRNDRSARGGLRAAVQAAAARAGVALSQIGPAAAGPDFPSLAGFPEGDPFEGVLAQRRAR
jgi:23S rRNA (cytosine1962-C5)-methyltransferase